MEKDTVADYLDAESQVISSFTELWDTAQRNIEIANPNKIWTSEEREKITKQNRIPYAFSKVLHPIGTLLGTQRDTRTDIKFLEREESSAHKVEIMNAYWKYCSDLYDFQYVESDVFQDGIMGTYGVFGIDIDRTKDYRGNVRVTREPYDELIWDTNFRQYDLSDANWQSKMQWYTAEDLIRKYPERKELIDLAGLDQSWSGQKAKKDYWYDDKRKLVATRKWYRRSWKNKYLIWKQGEAEPVRGQAFDTKKEAEKYIKEGQSFLQAAMNSNPTLAQKIISEGMPVFEVIEVPYSIVNESELLFNGVLKDEEEFGPCRFPYVPYFAYFADGEFWSAMDRLKDPQRFYSRMMSQIDYSIGTQAKGNLRFDPGINKNVQEDIKKNWGKTAFAFKAKKDQIEIIEGKGVPFQYFTILEAIDGEINNQFGGANFLGIKQTASESGRAVLARQSQAGLDNFVPLDNLKRSKQNLAELIAWYIENEIKTPRKLRIAGDAVMMNEMQRTLGQDFSMNKDRPNIGYLTMNTNENNSLEELEVDIVIDEAPHSVTKKQAVLNQIADAMKGGLPAPPPEVLLPLFELPFSVEQVWLKSIEESKQTPPPDESKVSVNYKDLPPEAQAAQLEKMGLPADLQSVIAKHLSSPEILSNQSKMEAEKLRSDTMLTKAQMQLNRKPNE